MNDMNEKKKTMIFGGAALILALLAFATTPSRVTPDAFLDQGEEFFPGFVDPNTATSLEVINFDEETGEAIPFKVAFKDGRWTIPSHNNYPADGKDRLAKTAAGVIGIKKDDFRSDNIADHAACGVVDPLDESTTSLSGRGQRVTIKGENEKILADFIVGETVDGSDGFRFVRVPGQKRVYSVRMNLDVSTQFSDWIEADLLKVEKDAITEIALKDYSINERTGAINRRDEIQLSKNGDNWKINRMPAGKEIDQTKVDDLVKAVDELKIVGVRAKPEGLSANLKRMNNAMEIDNADMLSLQSKGYYFSRDGSLLSNEGELEVRDSDGVIYTLRLGEIAYGSGFDVSAGVANSDQLDRGVAENRYLFISTRFDADAFPEPRAPASTDFLNTADSLWTDADRSNKQRYDAHQAWKTRVAKGRTRSESLNARFADWYYVISNDSFKKLDLNRGDLVKNKS